MTTGAADWQRSNDEVLRNYKNLNNLEKGTYYEIRVVAFDGYNRAASESKVVGTVGFGKKTLQHTFVIILINFCLVLILNSIYS